jgi:hypothetical protein
LLPICDGPNQAWREYLVLNQSRVTSPISRNRLDASSFAEKGYGYVDNFLPIEIHQKMRDTLTSQGAFSLSPAEIARNPWLEQFPWHFSPDVVGNRKVEEFDEMRIYLVHLLYLSTPTSKWTQLLLGPLLERLEDLRQLQRCKANLYPRDSTFFEHEAHADNNWEDAKGALYMVNSCNGYTKLHDGTKIKSVGNRMLFFKPHLEHCSTNTTDAMCRVTININYF